MVTALFVFCLVMSFISFCYAVAKECTEVSRKTYIGASILFVALALVVMAIF